LAVGDVLLVKVEHVVRRARAIDWIFVDSHLVEQAYEINELVDVAHAEQLEHVVVELRDSVESEVDHFGVHDLIVRRHGVRREANRVDKAGYFV
jgi:hypothetical protein